MSVSLQPHGLQPTRLLCPWNSLDKKTGVGSHSLLQGTFPAQGLNLSLIALQSDSLPYEGLGKPCFLFIFYYLSSSSFIIYPLLLTLGFVFLNILGGRLTCLFEIYLFKEAYIAINVLLRTAFAASHRFCLAMFSFSFALRYFKIFSLISSLTPQVFFNTMLLSPHIIVFFLFLFLSLISSFMPLWSEKTLEIIFIFLNQLSLVLFPSMWPTPENVPCSLGKNVYSDFLDVMAYKYQLSLNCSVVLFRICCCIDSV